MYYTEMNSKIGFSAMNLLGVLKQPWLSQKAGSQSDGLGTFFGVYLPSVLQMLGVILFMRLGWLTGHIGPWKMNLIIIMASSILFITGLSMTSIVTNMRVGSGGSYYMISRSLGMEFGSAIGILLSVAQLTTIAICVSGFSLSLHEILPDYSLLTLELCTIGILACISSFPAHFAMRAQALIFIIVIAAVISVFIGSSQKIPSTLTPLPTGTFLSFWTAFALFFPAATGIESGMSMSGDLRNPSRSLAIGTIASILTAYLVYAGLSFFLSSHVSAPLLRSYPMIAQYVSKSGPLFMLGILGATLSSALGSLLTAPRTLQALAQDKILPSALKVKEARILIILLATLLLIFTDMNHLLPILSMICLITYGLLNFVAFFETLLQNPSWRPLFKTPMIVSLSGVLACLMSMFMINAGASFIALFLVAVLCFWTTRRKLNGNWDDMRYSLFSFLAISAINKLLHLKKNPKSWRPNILAIVDPSLKEPNMIQFAHTMSQSKGFLTYGATISSQESQLEEMKQVFARYFEERDIHCFFHINVDDQQTIGNHHIIQNYGLGPLEPNTIVIKAPSELTPDFYELLCITFKLQKNIIMLKVDEENFSFQDKKEKQIDLWWGGKYHQNFELSLALAHIMQSAKTWQSANIIIKTLVPSQTARTHLSKLFEKYYEALRFRNLSFKPYIDETGDFYAHISKYATGASLTFLGLRAPMLHESMNSYNSYFQTLMTKTKNIPAVAYVLAGEKLNFQKIFE